MNAGWAPLAAACGVNDAASATSAACGAAMAPLCNGGYDNGGTLRSALLAPHSNCYAWRAALQTAAAAGVAAGGAPYLDAAMRDFCTAGSGSLTAECACLAFPAATAAAWCRGSSLSCPAFSDAQCAAKEFAQVSADGTALDVVQFAQCNPYYCWVAGCFGGPDATLLTSDVLAAQSTPGVCAGVCAQQVTGASTYITPMPPGSFAPASIVANVATLSECGGAVDAAMLVAVPQAWTWSENSVMSVPFAVTNDGDFPAEVTVAASRVGDMCALSPSQTTLWPRSAATFVLSCDAARVSAAFAASATTNSAKPRDPPSWTFAPAFQLSYLDTAPGKTQGQTVTTDWMGITATVLPPAPPVTLSRRVLPVWWWLAAAALLLLAAVLVVAVHKVGRRVGVDITALTALSPAMPAGAPLT